MGFETATTLHFHDHPDRDKFSACRIVVRENSGPTPDEIALSSGYWGERLKSEIKSTFGHYLTLGGLIEQLPYQDNFVTLSSDKKNEFGDPAIKTNWILAKDYEKKCVKYMSKQLKKILAAAGARDIFTRCHLHTQAIILVGIVLVMILKLQSAITSVKLMTLKTCS